MPRLYFVFLLIAGLVVACGGGGDDASEPGRSGEDATGAPPTSLPTSPISPEEVEGWSATLSGALDGPATPGEPAECFLDEDRFRIRLGGTFERTHFEIVFGTPGAGVWDLASIEDERLYVMALNIVEGEETRWEAPQGAVAAGAIAVDATGSGTLTADTPPAEDGVDGAEPLHVEAEWTCRAPPP